MWHTVTMLKLDQYPVSHPTRLTKSCFESGKRFEVAPVVALEDSVDGPHRYTCCRCNVTDKWSVVGHVGAQARATPECGADGSSVVPLGQAVGSASCSTGLVRRGRTTPVDGSGTGSAKQIAHCPTGQVRS